LENLGRFEVSVVALEVGDASIERAEAYIHF
jgi:hypothetical protein